MQVETFRKPEAPAQNTDSDFVQKCRERDRLCKELGLKAQIGRSTSISDEADKFYPRITGCQFEIWRLYLPTVYWRYHRENGIQTWQNYAFDAIPTRALEEIQFADSLKVFEEMHIWTPEQQTDPIVVGLTNCTIRSGNWSARHYLIARWAESLKPFAEIEQEVLAQRREPTSIAHLPQPIQDAILRSQRANPRSRIYDGGRTWFRSHCGQRYFKFITDKYLFVCGVCGFEMTKDLPPFSDD